MKPASTSLQRRVRKTWARAAQQACVEFESIAYTWDEVRVFAEALDAHLQRAGCGAGARVGVVARSLPGVLATQYALLATGRELVIVNPHQDAQALAAEVAALQVDALVAPAQDAAAGESLHLGRDRQRATEVVVTVRSPAPKQEPPAAVEMLTSGTTGAPKRVRMRAETVEAAGQDSWDTLVGLEQALQVAGREQPFLMFWPLTNIGGLSFVFHAVLEGRAMLLFERFDVSAYLAAVRRFQPAVLTLPPAHLRMVMAAQVARDAFASAAVVRSANAPLDPGLRDEFEQAYGVPIMTYYGATEFCGVVSGWPLDVFRRCRHAKAGSVGLPRPGVAFRIVDAAGAPLPAEETGTVEVRADRIGPEWLRTSDTGRIDEDGFLFLGGRSDGAINRGGFKVLPETIAAALRSHPAVYDAAIVGRPDARLGAVPVAFVELRPGCNGPTADVLREHARARLVAYQVPEQVHVLASLPRTPTLKVNLAELQRLAADAASQGDKP